MPADISDPSSLPDAVEVVGRIRILDLPPDIPLQSETTTIFIGAEPRPNIVFANQKLSDDGYFQWYLPPGDYVVQMLRWSSYSWLERRNKWLDQRIWASLTIPGGSDPVYAGTLILRYGQDGAYAVEDQHRRATHDRDLDTNRFTTRLFEIEPPL